MGTWHNRFRDWLADPKPMQLQPALLDPKTLEPIFVFDTVALLPGDSVTITLGRVED